MSLQQCAQVHCLNPFYVRESLEPNGFAIGRKGCLNPFYVRESLERSVHPVRWIPGLNPFYVRESLERIGGGVLEVS